MSYKKYSDYYSIPYIKLGVFQNGLCVTTHCSVKLKLNKIIILQFNVGKMERITYGNTKCGDAYNRYDLSKNLKFLKFRTRQIMEVKEI